MHEVSLVRALLKQVDELRSEHGGSRVSAVRIEIGPLSGVDRTLLELAFEQAVTEGSCRGAVLTIDEVPLSAVCLDCSAEIEVEQFRFVCSHCGSPRLRITGGDQVRLMDVTIEQADDGEQL